MKYIYLMLILGFVQCSNIKTVSDNSLLNHDDKTIQYILKKNLAEESDKNILYFTSGFNNENIEIKNGNDIIYSGKTSTIDQLSLAHIQLVTNVEPIVIKFNKSVFSLNHLDLIKYKFVYINRLMDNNKYLIEYSNKNRIFR